MDDNQEGMNASLREQIQSGQAEMRSKVSAIEENMEAAIHSPRAWRKETMARLEMMEARLECKKPSSEDMEPETEHQEKIDARIADMNDGRKEWTAC
jgi:hypothetical protein